MTVHYGYGAATPHTDHRDDDDDETNGERMLLGIEAIAEALHTANLLALHQALATTVRYHTDGTPYKANQSTIAEMGMLLTEVDERLNRG